MTTREKVENMLIEKGMFKSQAEQVVNKAISEVESFKDITWDSSAEEYPTEVYTSMWMFLRDVALEWIDKNLPQAWFRPMFVSE